jgi:PAS domain-containing protein
LADVPGVRWVAYAGGRAVAVFAPARAAAGRGGAAAVVVILATAALVVLLARRIEGPIRAIASAATAVAGGRFEVRAPVQDGGEISKVAAEFNRMLDQRLESERLLQQVIDAVPAIIHVKDLEGRYRLVNREFERVTGLASREAIGKRDSELFPAERAATVTRQDREALERGGVLFVEESIGPRHYLAGKAALRDPGGSAPRRSISPSASGSRSGSGCCRAACSRSRRRSASGSRASCTTA